MTVFDSYLTIRLCVTWSLSESRYFPNKSRSTDWIWNDICWHPRQTMTRYTTRLPFISAVAVKESARNIYGWGIWLSSGTFCPCCRPELFMPCLVRAYKIRCRDCRVSKRETLFGIFCEWLTTAGKRFISVSFVFVECFYSFGSKG